jgi:hypothetical protein
MNKNEYAVATLKGVFFGKLAFKNSIEFEEKAFYKT